MKNTKLLFSALVSAATLSCAPALFSADLTWNGSDGDSWDTTTTNWLNNNNPASFSDYDNVTFGSNAANEGTVVVNGYVSAGDITVSGAYTYTGGSVYANSLTVKDGGALTIDNGVHVTVGAIFNGQKGFDVAGTISGVGTLFLYLTNDADNKIDLGKDNGFRGTVIVCSGDYSSSGSFWGSFSLSDSDIGNGTYGISQNVTMRSSNDTEVSNNIKLWYDTKTLTVDSGTTLTLSGKLSDEGGIDKQGAGTLVLRGANTYTGGTTISSGTVVAANASAFGTGAVSVARGAKLEQSSSSLTLGGLSGAGTVEYTGSDAGTLTVNSSANETFSGAIVGENLSLVKTGAGTLTLSGENAYTGGTTISSGTVIAANDSALGTEGVTIDGGTLSIDSGVTLNASAISIVLGEAYLTTAAIDGSGSLAAETTITLSLDDALAEEILASGTKLEFQILGATFVENNSGFTLADSSFAKLDESYAWDYDAASGVLTIAALPEPSAFGLLAGIGALALVAARRRRGRKAA